MKRLLILTALCALGAAGCTTTRPSGDESGKAIVMRPTILISTTHGDMKAVLFPFYALIEGNPYAELHYNDFLRRIDDGYYNKAVATPRRELLVEYLRFSSASPGKDFEVPAFPRDVQPVRGTICIMRLNSGDNSSIFADMRNLMIIRKIKRNVSGQEVSPLRGMHFAIGQVVEGFDVLDKLGPNDSIVAITMLKEQTLVNAKKLEMLSNPTLAKERKVKPLDNFADVLSDKELEPAEPGLGDEMAP